MMKRWLAGWLSVIILFSGCLRIAIADDQTNPDSTDPMENADIQETMVTVEGEDLGTLTENIRFLLELRNNEDVQALLQNDEVKDVVSEIIWRVLVWMYQNRPVTMKILAELGVGEADLRCVGKLWDSFDRITGALEKYTESEDGRQLNAELAAVRDDPEIVESMENFRVMITSEDVVVLMDTLEKTSRKNAAERKAAGGSMTREAITQELDRSTFTGALIYELLSVMEKSDWARNSVPKLQENEKLWVFLNHLSSNTPELDRVLREECLRLVSDPEMYGFLLNAAVEIHALLQQNISPGPDEEKQETENGESTGEEASR